MSNSDVQLALEEMRRLHQAMDAANDALDAKVMSLLQTAGPLLAIAAALQAALTPGLLQSSWYVFFLALAAGLYFLLTIAAMYLLKPVEIALPLKADRDVIGAEILQRDEREALLALVAGYIESINANRRVNKQKGWLLRACLALLPIITGLLIALNFIPR